MKPPIVLKSWMINSRSIKARSTFSFASFTRLEKFLALQILAQHFFRFGDLLVDLHVGDHLVVDHGGDAVSEKLPVRGGHKAKCCRHPHQQVDRHDELKVIGAPHYGELFKETTP